MVLAWNSSCLPALAFLQRPQRLHIKPSQVPAVEVIPAGASYNPSFEDHQVSVRWVPGLTQCRFHCLEFSLPFTLPYLRPHLLPSLNLSVQGPDHLIRTQHGVGVRIAWMSPLGVCRGWTSAKTQAWGRIRGPSLIVDSPRTFTSAQALLREAHEVELQREKEVEKLERQLALPTSEQAATQVSPIHRLSPPITPPAPTC